MRRTFFYPCTPRGQGRPRFSGNVAYKTSEDRAYEAGIRGAYYAAYPGHTEITGPFSIDVTAVYPIPKSETVARKRKMMEGNLLPIVRPDIDNILKAVMDALNHAAYSDDKLAVECHMRKVYGAVPGLLVIITEERESEVQDAKKTRSLPGMRK